MSQPSKTLILWAHLRLACGSQQLCSARKTPAAFCLSLPARNERGESRREGKLIKNASSPRPSPPFLRRRGRENEVLRSMQIFYRTQLVKNLRFRLQVCATGVGNTVNTYPLGGESIKVRGTLNIQHPTSNSQGGLPVRLVQGSMFPVNSRS